MLKATNNTVTYSFPTILKSSSQYWLRRATNIATFYSVDGTVSWLSFCSASDREYNVTLTFPRVPKLKTPRRKFESGSGVVDSFYATA
jgi:hypothetical protein